MIQCGEIVTRFEEALPTEYQNEMHEISLSTVAGWYLVVPGNAKEVDAVNWSRVVDK